MSKSFGNSIAKAFSDLAWTHIDRNRTRYGAWDTQNYEPSIRQGVTARKQGDEIIITFQNTPLSPVMHRGDKAIGAAESLHEFLIAQKVEHAKLIQRTWEGKGDVTWSDNDLQVSFPDSQRSVEQLKALEAAVQRTSRLVQTREYASLIKAAKKRSDLGRN